MESWRSSHAWIAVADGEGNPLPGAKLEFFRFDDSPAAPSPAPLISTLEASPDVMTLDWDQVPGEALVRVSVPGYGVGFVYVESGGEVGRASLGPPMSLQGQILTVGERAVADATVVALGGGTRGVPLVEATSSSDGRFVLQGLSDEIARVDLRIRKEGFTILHDTMWGGDEEKVLQLHSTQPVSGRVEGLDGDFSGLKILTFKVPGVETSILEDGVFLLDHLPTETDVQLIVHGLPAGYTHRGVHVKAGTRDIAIQVTPAVKLMGRAVFADTDRPAVGARIYHENGPGGREIATADSGGWFSFSELPLGEVLIHASTQQTTMIDGVKMTIDRTGSRTLEIGEDRDLGGVEIRIY